MYDQGARLHAGQQLVDVVEFADGIAIPQVDRIELARHPLEGGAEIFAEARVFLPGENFLGNFIPAQRLAEAQVEAGQQQLRPVELDALVRVLVLGQLVVISLGLDPDRVGFQRSLRQLESPRGDLPAGAIGRRSAANRHHGLDEVGIHQTPVVRLGAAHRDAGGQHHLADLQVIAQHPVVQLHHVVIAVDRELAGQPVRWLGGTPQAKAVEEDDIEAVGVEHQPGADQRAAGETVARLADIPAVVHGSRITGEEGADDDGVDDLTLVIALGGTNCDVGRPGRRGAERFQRRAAVATVLPSLGICEVVLAADAEVLHLIGLL